MPTLSTVDLVIVAAYILAMTALGAAFSRRQKDRQAYFVGGRNFGWPMILISIVATETSAVTFLSVPGTAYNPDGGNFTFLQLAFGYILGRCLVAAILLPAYMRGELFSAYQVLKEKFGPAVQRVASGIFLATRTVADGLRLYLTALVMQYVGLSIEAAVIVVGVVTIGYTYLGGMKAVLWTDVIQFVIKIAGAALAGVFVILLLPGGWGQFVEAGVQAGKFTLFNFDPSPAVTYTLWAGVLGGAVFSMASHGADQMMVQRYLCARSLGQARTAVVLSGVVVFAQFALFLAVGVGLYAAKQAGVFAVGTATKDEVFGLFIVTKLPVGVVGILVAAILAAAMSTLSSSLNSSANAVVTDFYQPLLPARTETHYVLVSRLFTALFGVLQILVALVAHWAGSDRSVVDRVLAVAGFSTGLILGLFLLGLFRRPVPGWAAIAGLCTGFCAVLGVWLPAQFGTPILAWPWFAPVGAGTTVFVALLAARLFPAPPHGPAPTPADREPQPGVRPAG
jgi:solute:Na+ symporter, SSS family